MRGETILKNFKIGMRLSLAIACRSRGALRRYIIITLYNNNNVYIYPVSVCRPAPMVDKRAPIRIIHLVGKANNDTVKSPLLSPNLV